MKKIFTLIAVAAMALSANAQKITFGEADVTTAAGLNGKTFSNEGLVLTLTDADSKMAVDANNAYFGTTEAYDKYTHRLKSGAKSGTKSTMALTIPSAGTLKIYTRTGSNSATDRTLVITQSGTTLYNKVVQETDAAKLAGLDEADPTKETNIYPIIEVAVVAGTVEVNYPVGSMNFYGFKFVPEGVTDGIETVNAANFNANGVIYNLAGQKVGADFKGIVIKNGVKVLNK